MKVVWTPEAERDRDDIWQYLASENPRAALQIDQLFEDWVAKLEKHPKIGKVGKIPGTRELIPHESYRLVYEIAGEIVWILTIIHTARRWPPSQ